MDIDIKPTIGSKIYYYGETKIKGVLANEILSDKISVLSGNAIFMRTKDTVDVYALAHCINVKTKEIFEICDKLGNAIKSFDAFRGRTAEIEHAYNKLKNIDGKPHFDDVYQYLDRFLQPFIEKDMIEKIWDSNSLKWNDMQQKEKGAPSKPKKDKNFER